MRWQDGHRYAQDIVKGKINACTFVRQACERYLQDRKTASNKGLRFNKKQAQDVLDFFSFCVHIKGELARQPIELSPWQIFIVINLFGWVWKKTGLRRFKSGYIEVARKNGKSTFAAPIGLYMTAFDDEGGAEVYSAATTRDQAKIVFDVARHMVLRSELKKHLTAHKFSVFDETSASSFQPLASDADSLEGKNTHCGIIDELHAHKTRDVYDVLELSCGARSQPLLLTITTAGSDKTGICYEVRNYVAKILEGVIEDDTMFGMIYTLDEPKQWTNPDCWIQANPNLDVSVKQEDMTRLCQKAVQTPDAANQFKTKRLNLWCDAESAYFNMEKWYEAPAAADHEALRKLPCFIGLDLASKLDIAAKVCLFADTDRTYHVTCEFWLPEAVIDQTKSGKARHLMHMYQSWADKGLITLTSGNIIDYRQIRADILADAAYFAVEEIAFDPWGATQLAIQLQDEDGLPMVEVAQTVKNMSEAMKEVEALIIDGRLRLPDHPVLNWMASNVTAKPDRNDNIFPRKDHPESKIDGMVALIIAMLRAMLQRDDSSVYDDDDMVIL